MATVVILEAYYGGGVVLDYGDDRGYLAALELGLRTLLKAEPDEPPLFHLKVDGDDLSPWRRNQSPSAALTFLREYVTREYRYLPVLCRVGNSQAYAFSVLAEGDSGVEISPCWTASNAWYDLFWAALWAAGKELEGEDPSFRLLPRSGNRFCEAQHRMSPFVDHCDVCGASPAENEKTGGA